MRPKPGWSGGRARFLILMVPILIVLASAGAFLYLDRPSGSGDVVSRDSDLCPLDQSVGGDVVTMLFDFTKPLDGEREKSPGQLMRDLTLGLDRDAELRVYFLASSASAPRVLLKRLCKPYDNDDLQVEEAKDRSATVRDCNDLPAQLANGLRRSATRFCAAREALQLRLDALATKVWPEDRIVTNAYLVEAIEDIKTEISERQGRHQLHVFSDMMQHSNWYSHLDLEWVDWGFDKFAESFDARKRLFKPNQAFSDLGIDIYYLPRSGTTDQPRVKEIHWQFWREYFGSASLAFHEQPAISNYPSKPLMNLLTDAEVAAQERAQTEQLMLELASEQQALEQKQRELEVQRQQQAEAERQRESERQRQALVERQPEAERQTQLDSDQQLETVQNPLAESDQRILDGLQVETGQDAEKTPSPQVDGDDQLKSEPILVVETEEASAKQSTLTNGEQQSTSVRDATESSATGRAQLVDSQTAQLDAPLCPLVLSSSVEEMRPVYPNRNGADYGDAVITVRYVIDEHGETEDDNTTVVEEQSNADRSRYFNTFARAALRHVRNWKFSFDEANDQSCTKRRTTETAFRFRFD